MQISFCGKRALVTGAGKGIGRAITSRLAESGAEVIAVSRTQSDLDELTEINCRIKTLCLDVSDWKKTKCAIKEIGHVDLLVNNAAIAPYKMIGEITEEELDGLYDINIKSIINITQEIANGMKARGVGGSIVNISSISSMMAFPGFAAYASSKAALNSLTRYMAVEFGPHKIRVNSVHPTIVQTKLVAQLTDSDNEYATAMKNRTPLGRFGEVDDIAYPVLFLLSDKADLITGVSLPIDGGVTVTF